LLVTFLSLAVKTYRFDLRLTATQVSVVSVESLESGDQPHVTSFIQLKFNST